MPNDIPSTPVESAPFVNPQLDKNITSPKQRKVLDDSFKTFFQELDTPPATPSEAKSGAGTEPTKESVETPPEPETKPEPEPEPKPEDKSKEEPKPEKVETPAPPAAPAAPSATPPTAPAAKPEEPKVPDIEALEPHPNASEAQKSQFKQLKEAAKTFATEAKLLRSRLAPVLADAGIQLSESPEEIGPALDKFAEQVKAWKSGAMAPEIQVELDTLRSLARTVDVKNSDEFKRDYVKPVETAYLDVIEEMAKYFEAEPEKIQKEFLEPLKTQFKPHQLPPEWWDSQVELMKKAPATIRRKIENKIADLFQLQEKHDKRITELSDNKASYEQWQQERQSAFAKDWDAQLRNEVEKELATNRKMIAGWRPMPLDGVSDPEKRKAIEAHNARFAALEQRFGNIILGFNQGPRSAARLGLEFIELEEGTKAMAQSLKDKHDELEALKTSSAKEVEDLKKEISTLKEEVTRKRKIADAPVKPTAGTGTKTEEPAKPKLPKDARGSLKEAFDSWKL